MTNGFALNHDKSLQIHFFYVKRQAKNDFLKDVESTVTIDHHVSKCFVVTIFTIISHICEIALTMIRVHILLTLKAPITTIVVCFVFCQLL